MAYRGWHQLVWMYGGGFPEDKAGRCFLGYKATWTTWCSGSFAHGCQGLLPRTLAVRLDIPWHLCRSGENSRRKDLSSSILVALWVLGILSCEPRISQAKSGLPDGQSTWAYDPFSACQILYHFGAEELVQTKEKKTQKLVKDICWASSKLLSANPWGGLH